MDITTFLAATEQRFTQAGIESARLDAQLLLSDALDKDRAWLLANPESKLPKKVLEELEAQVTARCRRIPLAYIRGHATFYGREFVVNPNVLIPRPETEGLITLIKQHVRGGQLLDVGTGSGIIAITAALEMPYLAVEACDASPEALKVAIQNAALLGARVRFFTSDLLSQVTGRYDTIVANLPYVSRSWEVSPETAAEPAEALFADDDGLALIYKLIAEAPKNLITGGHLILEADPRQHQAIQKAALEHGFRYAATDNLGLCFVA
jgi:release factor glutamine methyltransferase